MKRPLLRISSNRINDNVKSSHRFLESLLFIIHSLFSTQALDVVQIGKAGARDYVKTSLAGQLHGVRTHVACGSKDEKRLPGSYLGIFEEHLPSRDTYNWSRCCLDKIQRLWLM